MREQGVVMGFPFDLSKTIQATALLIRENGGQPLSHFHLMKLLYIADRESLNESGFPITGDTPQAKFRGPVLQHTLALARGEQNDAAWEQYLTSAEESPRVVTVRNDPGTDNLCQYEIDKLKDVVAKYAKMTEDELISLTHAFGEWKQFETELKKNPEGTYTIKLGDILDAIEPESKIAIEHEAEYFSSLENQFPQS